MLLFGLLFKGYKKNLEDLFLRYPEHLFANAVDDEGNNGILLVAAEDDMLTTLKRLDQEGVSIDKRNYYGRTALMKAALWGCLELSNTSPIMAQVYMQRMLTDTVQLTLPLILNGTKKSAYLGQMT